MKKPSFLKPIKKDGNIDEIKAERSMNEWKMDPKGYFLIRINEGQIEAGYCSKENELLKVIKGKDPYELYYTIIREELVTTLQHAAYLGSEFQKAYICLKTRKEYVQDEEIVKT